MLRTLKYKVKFSSTGRTLEADLSLGKGLTVITGPNEAGKSLIVEMFRFCLYGSDALRGSASDYAELKVSCEVEIRSKVYTIDRTISGARIYADSKQLATGITPVNRLLLELIGFDLTVFDVACAANQGDIEKLSNTRPTARKQMVDQVIGAARIEEIAKWSSEKISLYQREIDVLERNLIDPGQPPVKPEGCTSVAFLTRVVDELRSRLMRKYEIEGLLKASPHVDPPVPPKNFDQTYEQALTQYNEVSQLESTPVREDDTNELDKQWRAYDLWLRRVQFEKDHPKPTRTQHEIDSRIKMDELVQELSRYLSAPKSVCPCGKEFTAVDHLIERCKKEIAAIGRVDEFNAKIEAQLHQDWESIGTLQLWTELANVQEVSKPLHPRPTPQALSATMTRKERDDRLNGRSSAKLRGLMMEINNYNNAFQRQREQLKRYEEWVEGTKDLKRELALLANVQATLGHHEGLLKRTIEWEGAQRSYELAKKNYDVQQAKLQELKKTTDSWRRARTALNDIRAKVKTYLIPALSKVSSALLSQMTGGARNRIEIDEEFEMKVDGQPIHTLSGSGKACANLALRIGLGQVLTNNVMSIFIGDEVDASMDDKRAAYIQKCLSNLVGHVGQILIVTHKAATQGQIVSIPGTGAQVGSV